MGAEWSVELELAGGDKLKQRMAEATGKALGSGREDFGSPAGMHSFAQTLARVIGVELVEQERAVDESGTW